MAFHTHTCNPQDDLKLASITSTVLLDPCSSWDCEQADFLWHSFGGSVTTPDYLLGARGKWSLTMQHLPVLCFVYVNDFVVNVFVAKYLCLQSLLSQRRDSVLLHLFIGCFEVRTVTVYLVGARQQ